jgi:hypothetical protein
LAEDPIKAPFAIFIIGADEILQVNRRWVYSPDTVHATVDDYETNIELSRAGEHGHGACYASSDANDER